MARATWQERQSSGESPTERKAGKSMPQAHFPPTCCPVPCVGLTLAKPSCEPKNKGTTEAAKIGPSTALQERMDLVE